jgi:ATP-dependent DNA helicase PIF1
MFALIPGEEKVYLSCDSPSTKPSMMNMPDDIHTPEFLNSINASVIANHKIILKVGVPVMLMRNLDPTIGLYNGTRLIITKMGKYVLEGRIITRSNIGEEFYIPRLYLTPSDTRIHFKFQHRQFPVSVCFAMTINKSQAQSLKQVGIYLLRPVFSHGQLHVAISRVTSRNGLKILLTDDDDKCINTTSNVVYKEVYRNL